MWKIEKRHLPNKVQVIMLVLTIGSAFAGFWSLDHYPKAAWSIALQFVPPVLVIVSAIYTFWVRRNQDELQLRIIAGSGAATLWVYGRSVFWAAPISENGRRSSSSRNEYSNADVCMGSDTNHLLQEVLLMENSLKELRAKLGISQADLGDQLDVSRQTINSIEKGKYDPSLPLAFKIAQFFNQPIEAIFTPDEQ